MSTNRATIATVAACVACVAALIVATLAVVSAPAASAQTAGTLTVTPSTIELGQPFSISASGCPGPNPVGADYSVMFQVNYLPPPQLPGDPDPGSYNVTLQSTPIGNETYVATWSLPMSAPTLGSAYRVAAQCMGNELGQDFVWFDYPSASLTLIDQGIVLATDTTVVTTGQSFRATATGCPGPNPVGADYRVEYLLEYLTPAQFAPGPPLGTFSQTYVVGGAYGDHAVDITIPIGAPTIGGVYELTAECWGNELGADFLWHSLYNPVVLSVSQGFALCGGATVTVFTADGQVPTAGDDVVLGSPSADTIDGLAGDDLICGGDGGDLLTGGSGDDSLFGQAGSDVVRGNTGNDFISGGIGDDRLFGGTDADTIDGGDGDDYIGGFGGADVITGGPGNEVIFGGFGADTIDGGPGDDMIRGMSGDDVISGSDGFDRLYGDRGNDIIHGDAGDDTMRGGKGDDQLFGDDGDDTLRGGKADDNLVGGAGTDICAGNKENVADTADTTCETIRGVP